MIVLNAAFVDLLHCSSCKFPYDIPALCGEYSYSYMAEKPSI